MLAARWQVVLLTACAVLAAAVFPTSAVSAEPPFELSTAFGPDGTTGSEFSTAASVAVDGEDEVLYVLDRGTGTLYKFDLEGNPVDFGGSSPNLSGNKLSGLATGEANAGERQIAVNPVSHVVYVTSGQVEGRPKALEAFQANGEPAVFSATGTNKITGFFFLLGVAVDENGDIYTSDGGVSGAGVQVYDESGAVIVSSLGVGGPLGPANGAVDSKGVLYVQRTSYTPARYTPSEYPVTPTTTYTGSPDPVDSNKAHGLAVDRRTDNLYVAEFSPTPRVAVFDDQGSQLGTFAGPGQSGELKAPEGIAAVTIEDAVIGEEEERVYVADSPAIGPSRVKIFVEAVCDCPPTIESTTVSDVTGESATLHAKINPNNQATTYWFEYGLNDCAVGPCEKVPAGGEALAAGKKAVMVQFGLTGLQPETTYYFRVVAENGKGPEAGASESFTTQAAGVGAALPDSRAWEMVSPPKKFGGVIVSTNSTAIQASSAGDKLAYASIGSLLKDATSNRPPEPATLLAARSASGGWATRDLTPPHAEASLFLHGQTEFKIFTPDLLKAEMEPSDDFPLSPQASERTPYLWSDTNPASFIPLVNPTNVPPGTKFGPNPGENNSVRVEAVSPDLSHIALRSIPPLVPGAAEESLYMWSDGALEAVSELPQSEGGDVVTAVAGTGQGSVRHAVSKDGSRVFWTSTTLYNNAEIGKAGLYLRNRLTDESVRLDVKKAGASGAGDKRPAFNGASADGGVVFFTDTQHLTVDASPAGRDLYRCEIGAVGGGGLGCAELTDISAPPAGSGESAEVIDQVPALSEDGTRLFFVARGVLDDVPNEEGEIAAADEPNLYYWAEGQAPRFVATLAEEDHLVWGEIRDRGYTVNISAASSPDGRYFVFTSEKSLTGYENRNAADKPNTEVFLYDTEADGDRLACVSCNPSGAIAVGEQLPDEVAFFPPDPGGLWANRWVAATLPQATQTESAGSSLYRSRGVLDNGRVFFNAVDPLVSADSNGDWDVYQYEPVGVGGCTAKTNSSAVTRSGDGCVGLLSPGSVEGDAGFLDASVSGKDVFFLTRSELSVLDRDEEMDVYDARVNGIPATLTPVQECSGETCRTPVTPPGPPALASESGENAGPRLVCRKGQRKVRRHGRTVCIRKKKHGKHKKHRHKSSKKKNVTVTR